MNEYVPTANLNDLSAFQRELLHDTQFSDMLDPSFTSANARQNRILTLAQSGYFIIWDGDNQPALPKSTPTRTAALRAKRAIDIVGAIAGLVFLAPLLLLIALMIRMTDGGPALFRQERVGFDGKTFRIFKFRSMYADRGDLSGIAQTKANDDRVTPIGRCIRRTSIDELPQLLNVLTGDMSLVGPRPHVAGMLAAGVPYEQLTEHYGFRHVMRPGLTGWAQCNSLRGSTANERLAMARVGHDIAYIQHFSLALDVKIIAKTIWQQFLTGSAH